MRQPLLADEDGGALGGLGGRHVQVRNQRPLTHAPAAGPARHLAERDLLTGGRWTCFDLLSQCNWGSSRRPVGGGTGALMALALALRLAALACLGATLVDGGQPPAACTILDGLTAANGGGARQQAAAFAWASRGSLRLAVPCFAAALQHSGQHAWLWVDYARALQGAVRNDERAVGWGCEGATAASVAGWADELEEARAAAQVALLLNDQRDVGAALLAQKRLIKTTQRHDELSHRCDSSVQNATESRRLAASSTAWLVAALASGRPQTLNDAVELARARCTDPSDITADFTQGWATAFSVRDALLSLRVCGVVKLTRVWTPSALDPVAAAHRREFDEYLANNTEPADSEPERATRRGVQRWRGRWESQLPLAPPFNDPSLTMQPSLLTVLQAALGSARLELDTFTQITSIGGAGSQPFHADVGPLWSQNSGGGEQLAPHGLVVVVPLLNVTSQRGPTAFQPASHFLPPGAGGFWKARDAAPPAGVLSPTAEVGDAIVFDLRLRHRGGQNLSPDPRPLLYMSFVHEWWQDRLNFAAAQSDKFDALASQAKKLHSRLDHREHVRRLTALLREAGVDPGESAYEFQQQALSL